MWISKQHYNEIRERVVDANDRAVNAMQKSIAEMAVVLAKNTELERFNAELRSTVEWMKIRLNAVEKERAQLIAAAIGVKVAIPEFMPRTDRNADPFNEMPDITTVGNDAKEDDSNLPPFVEVDGLGREEAVDYSMMPGYRPQR